MAAEHDTRDAYCLGCGYALRGLTESVCTECGRRFCLDDPRSFSPRPKSFRQFWIGPPPTYSIVVLCLLTAWWTYQASYFQGMFSFFGVPCFVVLALVLFLLDYIARVIRSTLMQRGGMTGGKKARRWRWLVTPLCLAVFVSTLGLVSWPLKIRFLVSKPKLESLIDDYNAGRQISMGAQDIGLLHVKKVVELEPGILAFQIANDWVDSVGIMHRPQGRPPTAHQRLGDNWYLVWW